MTLRTKGGVKVSSEAKLSALQVRRLAVGLHLLLGTCQTTELQARMHQLGKLKCIDAKMR